MRDVIYTPYRSRFEGCSQRIKKCKHSCVVDVFILLRFPRPVNTLYGVPLFKVYIQCIALYQVMFQSQVEKNLPLNKADP